MNSKKRARLTGGIALAILLACVDGALAGERPSWIEGELLVAVRPGVERSQAVAMYRSHGAKIIDEIPEIRVHVLRVAPTALRAVKRALSRRHEVEFVERNAILPPTLLPNDPLYAEQWHLRRIEAVTAWDVTVGDPGVVVAILDSGVDPTHPDLASKLVPGYNFYDNNTDTSDVYGHGTQVAGAAGAIAQNGTGVASVAWQNPLMPIRVTNTAGSASVSAIAKGLTWATDHGARVMNLSFFDVAGSTTIRTAAQYVVGKGGVVVAAAGNCSCVEPTAENPYIISVSATNYSNGVAAFSSTGSYVDVAAPGVTIYTTTMGGGYASSGGTSIASPITAGVVALMMSANTALGPNELEALLEENALDLGDPGYDTSFGFGLVNADAAVNAATAVASAPTDTTPPSVSISSPADSSTLSGVAVVDVMALDDRGVSRVELYVDDVLIASDTASPFSFGWDTSTATGGAHGLRAMAFDTAGNASSSPLVEVSVPSADTTPPGVQITSPSDGSTATKNVKIAVNANDDQAMSKLEVFVDGVKLGSATCSGTSCAATFVWKTARVSSGAHVVAAVAYDGAGNSTNAPNVTVYR
jgi:subtilisin family serine protease